MRQDWNDSFYSKADEEEEDQTSKENKVAFEDSDGLHFAVLWGSLGSQVWSVSLIRPILFFLVFFLLFFSYFFGFFPFFFFWLSFCF